MLFNSFAFIFGFLPIVLVVCFVLARHVGAASAQVWLTAASLYFYAQWSFGYLLLLILSILVNYSFAVLMIRSQNATASRWFLVSAIAIDLLLLGYFKYTGFLISTIDAVAGTSFDIPSIMLPLGISFYTFQQLTLLVDISGGRVERVRFRDFLLFVTFFPHLIAGPIVHHREMMPQFEKADYRFDLENMAVGVTLFAVGLFKKAVLADGIAASVSPIYDAAATGRPITMLSAVGAAVGFMLQIYFDFSGYSEMALGLARFVGIKLPMNFNSPLKARNVIQFWACWHITLTRFLTAYIYNPLAIAMTRRSFDKGGVGIRGRSTGVGTFAAIVALPTVTTMFLSGLWHGAGNQFLVFGLLHACYLTVNHAWNLWRPRGWAKSPGYRRIMGPGGLVITFGAVVIAETFFRADTVTAGWNIVGGMFGAHGVSLPSVVASRLPSVAGVLAPLGVRFEQGSLPDLLILYGWIALLLPIALVLPNILQLLLPYQPAITLPAPWETDSRVVVLRSAFGRLVWQPSRGWAIAVALAGLCGVLSLTQVTEFLYWRF